jgi:hypothetical protein
LRYSTLWSGLIRPLSDEQKRSVPTIFGGALLTTTLLYISIGCCCAYYFGEETKQSINLNFVDFTWGMDTNDKSNSSLVRRLVSLCSLIVVVFPALDTLSVFPLIANTLGNNLYAAVPKTKKYLKKFKFFGSDKTQIQLTAKILWRLVASVPPIIVSSVITELSFSLQLAGICGIVVALVTPALLHKSMMGTNMLSLKDLFTFQRMDPTELSLWAFGTPYASSISHQPVYSTVVLFVAFGALIICAMQMISSS